jgi:hypothetical protein
MSSAAAPCGGELSLASIWLRARRSARCGELSPASTGLVAASWSRWAGVSPAST